MSDTDNIKNGPIQKEIIPTQNTCKCHCEFCTVLDQMEAAFPAMSLTDAQALAISEFTDLLMRTLDELDEANEFIDRLDEDDEDDGEIEGD